LTIAGVAIGVGFIIFLISLGYGLQRISTQQIANLEALQIIDVTPGKSHIITINDETMEKFSKLANVTDAEAQVNMVGNISYGSSTSEGVIYGKNMNFLKLEDPQLEAGSIYKSNQDKKVLVNKTALKRLGINDSAKAVGQKINLKINIAADFFAGEEAKAQIKEEQFEIVGVLKNESSPYVYIPLEAFRAYGVTKYSAGKVRVKDKESVDVAKKQLENIGFKTVTLKDTVDQINQFFLIFQLILLSFGAIAVLVAALGMFNTLTISLLEKTREISFMKILGTTSADIWNLFLSEAILIGVIGAGVGIAGGTLVGSGLNNFIIDMAQKTGNKPVEIFYTPPVYIVLGFVVAVAISVLTGIYPSFRASKIDPLEAMRYE
jgi:putative ABC transport system permease protein